MLDWLKYAQSETTGIKLGFSKGEVAELDAQIDAALREAVDEEVNRRLAARGLTVEVQQNNGNRRSIRDTSDSPILTSEVKSLINLDRVGPVRRNADVIEVEGFRNDEQS